MAPDVQNFDVWCGLAERLASDIDLSATARQFGAFERARGVRSAEDLLRLALIYGTTSLSLRATAAWASAHGLSELSDVALLYRLQGSDSWLEALVSGLLSQALQLSGSSWVIDRRMRLIDGTMISSPGAGQTSWRLHADYDLGARRFVGFELSDRHGSESLERFEPSPGDVFLADRYYAKVAQLAHVVAHGADFLVRRGLTSCRLQHQDGRALDIGGLLKSLDPEHTLDLPVLAPLPECAGRAPLKARLIIRHIGRERAEQAHRRVRRKAAKSGHKASAKRLKAAEYVMLMTSLPAEQVSADQVLQIYRLRWQIELAFKRLKSLMGFKDLRAKDPRLVRACLYAKLIMALITEDITSEILDSFPSAPTITSAVNLATPEHHLQTALRPDPRQLRP